MRLFINGGCSGTAAAGAYDALKKNADTSRPVLVIPFACDPEKHSEELERLKKDLQFFSGVEAVTSGKELGAKYMGAYGAVFICGGNAFRLLDELKSSGGFEMLMGYAKSGGVIFAEGVSSAILGADIDGSVFFVHNDVGLSDTAGLDLLGGAVVFPRYRSINRQQQRFLEDYSSGRIVFALPKEVTLYLDGDSYEIIGSKNAFQFVNGKKTVL